MSLQCNIIWLYKGNKVAIQVDFESVMTAGIWLSSQHTSENTCTCHQPLGSSSRFQLYVDGHPWGAAVMVQILGSSHPQGRPGLSSRLPAWTQPGPGC